MAKSNSGFYAYPSSPPNLGETIENAIARIRKMASTKVRSWRSLSPTGKYIVDAVIQAIRPVDVFICDLTYPNANVLFELGYAVARFKNIWITIDLTVEGATQRYEQFNSTILPVIGYSGYENSEDLATAFVRGRPWSSMGTALLGAGFEPRGQRSEKPSVLYLTQPHNTEERIGLSETLSASQFAEGLVTDDPNETHTSTLTWYAENVRDTDATLVHLLSTNQRDHEAHNLKCAFVAGLAVAFNKPLLMLAPQPFTTPVDYKALLVRHSTAKQCQVAAEHWLEEVASRTPKRRVRPSADLLEGQELDLRALRVGDWVAENEHSALDNYFVPTRWYYDALSGAHGIFVGRRGSGKSATLYALQDDVGRNRLNHVCVIKPVGYEIHGLIRVLSQNVGKAESGYLIESLWKYLIYTDLAASVARRIYSDPSYKVGQLLVDDKSFLSFYERNSGIIDQPFSVRFSRAIEPLMDLDSVKDFREQRAKISEHLHHAVITQLRIELGNVLSKRKQVAILIDNLDESWGPGTHVDHMISLLFGLMNVSVDVAEDLRDSDAWKKRINAAVALFVRSDIFAHLQQFAPERDKLPVQRVTWGSHEELLRLVDERLLDSTDRKWSADEIWTTLFAPVGGMAARDFIAQWSVRRPRDVIFFAREAISTAVNRGDRVVTEEDIRQARHQYSQFAFQAVLAEDDPRLGKLEAVLLKFSRTDPELTYSNVVGRIATAGVRPPDQEFYVNLLCDLNFLGIETRDGFAFAEHEQERRMLREVAREGASQRNGAPQEERYLINRAFYDVLQIQ